MVTTIATRIVALIMFINCGDCIDRTQYTNFKGNERHDNYMVFSSDLNFPLSLKWNAINTSCTFENGILSFAFTNDIFYCVTNEIWDERNYINESVYAFNTNNGKIIWNTHIHQHSVKNKNISISAFDGIVSIPPNYVAIIDNNNANLYILNSSDGNIICNISVYSGCKTFNDQICIHSTMVSSTTHNSIIVLYPNPKHLTNITLFYYNLSNNQSKSFNITQTINASVQIPTICGNDVIVITNLFGETTAFVIEDNDNLSFLWKHSMNVSDGVIYINPALCIPRTDGSFNILINSVLSSPYYEEWKLLNGETGDLIKNIEWIETMAGLPVINKDKMILITTNINLNSIIAFNISDINGNWVQLWNITNNITKYTYMDIMIVNDNVFLSNQQGIDVLSIQNGTKVFSWSFPVNNGFVLQSHLTTSIDTDNKPLIISLAVQSFNTPDMKSTLYALT